MSPSHSFVLGRIPSPVGTILLVVDGDGRLRALDFETHEARMRRLLGRHYGGHGYALRDGAAPGVVAAGLAAFFAGDLAAVDALDVATNGSPFQRRVWTALRAIAPGTTTTYGALAGALGQPTAARAVGLANGANPIAIVVPCHRVVGADGSLTGYGGGLERKEWLLAHERTWTATTQRRHSA